MEDNKHIELKDSGLICDNPNCDWEDKTITFEIYKDWINRPCPKCGENVLTEQDYKNAENIRMAMAIINSLSAEELEQLSGLVDPEMAKDMPFFKDAKGLEFLSSDGKVSMMVDTHLEIKVTEITPAPEEPEA